MSELQAAMGLSVLPFMDTIFTERIKVVDFYDKNLDFKKVRKMQIREGTEWNHSYYPAIFESEAQLLKAEKALNNQNIYPRRYFYPSLNTIEYTNGKSMPISESIASRILCLPLFFDLTTDESKLIINLINNG